MRRCCYLLILLTPFNLLAQYANMDAGLMYMNYKRKGPFKDCWWPGVTIQLAEVQFSRYAGSVPLRDSVPGVTKDWKPNGTYWSIGYNHTYTKFFNKNSTSENRPVLTPTAGFALGGWRTHVGGSVFNLSASGTLAINVLPGFSLVAGAETGVQFWGLFGTRFNPIDPVVTNVQDAFSRFYFNPKLGFRVYYDFRSAIGSFETQYVPAGWHTSYHVSNGVLYYRNTWHDAHTYTKVVTTKELITLAPTVVFPRGFDGVGASMAAGSKITLRYGILAADFQYLKGKIGFHLSDGSFAGSLVNQCYWDYEAVTGSLGLNIFSLRAPFKGASIVRFMLGRRFGKANITAHYTGPSTHILPAPFSGKNVKTSHFYMAAELGRFGFGWDFMKNPERKYEKTGGLFSAYYMIPLIKL